MTRRDNPGGSVLWLAGLGLTFRSLQSRFRSSYVIVSTLLVLTSPIDLQAASSWPDVRQEIAKRFPEVPLLSTPKLAEWLADAARPQPLILDVRSRAEYDISHLPNAIWAGTVPLQTEALKQSPPDRPVVFYCSVGWRSGQAAARWVKSGRRALFNLDGSIFQWANEGRTLTDAQGKGVSVVHPNNKSSGALLERSRWSHTP
jgi:rhodanese-related sulfurtransferase